MILARSVLTLLAASTLILPATAAEVVKAGAGSYLDALPPGVKGPQPEIFKTEEVKGAMPTNDWWSSLAWVKFSDTMYPHPLAVKATESGLRVFYPGATITANPAAIFGFMPSGGDDFVLGHSVAEKFADARVAGWSDWFVTAQLGTAERNVRFTFGHGSPFVYAQYTGGSPTVRFAKPPEIFAGTAKDAVLGVKIGPRCYGLFAPTGSTWEGIGTANLAAQMGGKGYFSVAVLPDDKPETLALFRRYAYAHVTDSRVAWKYDPATASVTTTFQFETKPMEGQEKGTLTSLYPHQWRGAKAEFTGQTYASVRGPMKLAAGAGFSTQVTLPPLLPGLPLTTGIDRAKLRGLLLEEPAGRPAAAASETPAAGKGKGAEKPQLTGDTYWLGKQLGKWATMLPLAEQAGEKDIVDELTKNLRTALEDFFTATNAAGQPDAKGLFAYDKNWGTLIGYPASFGSDNELNDHHFHYGYFLRAAGELARRDPAWASDAQWGAMLKIILRDVASTDRNDPLFPFMRNFDPYAGHTWASGHSKFADGNNNESSSEAINAWYGVMLLGEAIGDTAMRDLGAWLLATEVSAIEDYWFDVRDELHPKDFSPSVVTMVWGGKGANGTWFSDNPEAVHGINFLPVSPASYYLGRWPDYAKKNYTALVEENLAHGIKNAAKKNQAAPTDGAQWDQWADIIWMYRALSDPQDALKQWNARAEHFKPEAGNSLAATYAWITALNDLGAVDREVTANTPFAITFKQAGRRTHVAWNLGTKPLTVTFSDGVKVECAPGKMGVK